MTERIIQVGDTVLITIDKFFLTLPYTITDIMSDGIVIDNSGDPRLIENNNGIWQVSGLHKTHRIEFVPGYWVKDRDVTVTVDQESRGYHIAHIRSNGSFILDTFGRPIVDYVHDEPKVRGFTSDHTVALVYGWYHKHKL
jgi:hypothetical protein